MNVNIQCDEIVQFYGVTFNEGDCWVCMELMDASLEQVSIFLETFTYYFNVSILCVRYINYSQVIVSSSWHYQGGVPRSVV